MVLIALGIACKANDDSDVVAGDLNYSNMAGPQGGKQNASMKASQEPKTPSWAVGARLNNTNLGITAKKNLVGKTLIQKNSKVGTFNFFDEQDVERFTYKEVHTSKGLPGSEVLPSVVEPLALGSGPMGASIYTRQRIPLNDPRIHTTKDINKLLDDQPYEAIPPPLPAFGQHQPTHVGGGAQRGRITLQQSTHYPFKKPDSSNFFEDDGPSSMAAPVGAPMGVVGAGGAGARRRRGASCGPPLGVATTRGACSWPCRRPWRRLSWPCRRPWKRLS